MSRHMASAVFVAVASYIPGKADLAFRTAGTGYLVDTVTDLMTPGKMSFGLITSTKLADGCTPALPPPFRAQFSLCQIGLLRMLPEINQ